MTTFKKSMLMLGVAAMTAFAVPAFAADAAAVPAAGVTFGIINMDKITETSDVGKNIRSQIDTKRKEYIAELKKQEEALSKTKQQLDKEVEDFKAKQASNKSAVPNPELEKKISAYQEKYRQNEILTQSRKDILAVAYETAINNLRKQAAEIVAEQAKAKNYSAVFMQNAVMMSAPGLDMTDGVIKQVNDKVKKIPVDWAAASDIVSGKKK